MIFFIKFLEIVLFKNWVEGFWFLSVGVVDFGMDLRLFDVLFSFI